MIDYPAGWSVSHIAEGKNLDSTFADHTGELVLRVDENPDASGLTPDTSAAPVIAGLRRQSTYVEIGLSHETFAGFDALRWEFEDTENRVPLHKVDEFFVDPTTGHGWGILIQAPQSLWPQDAEPLGSYAQTFQPN